MDMPGYIVLSRLAAQQRATDVLAHNMANVDTPGFRASQAVFASHLARQTGTAASDPAVFTLDRATWRDTSPGPLQATGNPLDLALPNEGFFVVETPRGERYTRAGRFTLSPAGDVVDAEGHALLGDGGPLAVPEGATGIAVAGDGTLRTDVGIVGRVRVVRFADQQRLLAEGDRLLAAPPGLEAEPVAQPGLVQGSVEGSNVRPVVEMVRMMAELREFQFAAQFAEREGERLSGAVDRILRRR